MEKLRSGRIATDNLRGRSLPYRASLWSSAETTVGHSRESNLQAKKKRGLPLETSERPRLILCGSRTSTRYVSRLLLFGFLRFGCFLGVFGRTPTRTSAA